MGYANPVKQLLKEAHLHFGEAEVGTLLSLGTGKIENSKPIDTENRMQAMARQVTLDAQRSHEDVYERLKETGIYFRLNESAHMDEGAVSDTIDEVVRSFQVDSHGISLKDINSVAKVEMSFKPRPSLTRNFVGRDDILDKLYEMHFSGERSSQGVSTLMSILTGLGGSGKTQIALKFALEYESRHPAAPVYFLDARSQERLETELETIIRSRGSAYRSRTHQDAIDWIAGQERWLLIFDNADDPSLRLFDYIPNSSGGHVLITSRNDLVRVQAPENSHKVDSLSLGDASHLLLVSSGYTASPDNLTKAKEIARELGCLPLAVAHAAGYITIHRCLDTYLHLYRQRRRELLSRSDPNVVQGREGSVSTTIQLSFERLSTQARYLLQLFSLFHATSISHSIIEKAALRNFAFTPFALQVQDPSEEEHASALMALICPSGAWSEFDFNEMIQQCLQYSLLQIITGDGATKYYTIHVLVQSWLRLDLPQDHLFQRLLIRILACGITADDNYENLIFHRSIIPHIEGAVVALNTTIADSFAFGFVLEEARHSLPAVQYLERALVLCIEALGDTHPDTISAMGRLAASLDSCGEFRAGMELKLRVLQGRKRLFGEEHPDTLRVMSNLARSFDWLGMYEEAVEMDELVLGLRRRVQGDDHPDVLLTLANLAVSLKKVGRLEEAVELEAEVLKIRTQLYGENNVGVLTVMGNLGYSLCEIGKYEDALVLQRRSVELWRGLAGEDHADTLSAIASLAHTLAALKRDEEAMELRSKAFEGFRSIHGIHHPVTLLTKINYTLSLCAMDRMDEAVQSSRSILRTATQMSGSDYAALYEGMENLSQSLANLGEMEVGDDLHQFVIRMRGF
ncbi:hypothetical protein FRC20_011775 [Serendipita sp. 405]|nr:hypothetical protein FRC20_011775 [Serendipita sp. 405]